MSDPKVVDLVATPDPLKLSQDVENICLGSGRLTQVSWARHCCKTQETWICHSQATWVRCTFTAPSILDLQGDVRPKLIIIIKIITTIDFTFKIKSFFSIVIIFIVNLIIFIIQIIIFLILIIILNLPMFKWVWLQR
jgi:hypothetical protein